jgi:hypothetical protein
LDATGLVSKIYTAAFAIDFGRKGFATRGKAEEGRISYETGISLALFAFRDAQSTVDPHIIIIIEYTFLNQELQFCDETDTDSKNSLSEARQRFDDAFLALEVVEDSNAYKSADKVFSRKKDFRIKGFPKDGFHVACAGHQTRLKNILRSPGIDPIEKTLLKQRLANMSTAQKGYIEKQKKVFAEC